MDTVNQFGFTITFGGGAIISSTLPLHTEIVNGQPLHTMSFYVPVFTSYDFQQSAQYQYWWRRFDWWRNLKQHDTPNPIYLTRFSRR